MQVIVLYFFESKVRAPFYQADRKVYSNQPLAGIFSILLHFRLNVFAGSKSVLVEFRFLAFPRYR